MATKKTEVTLRIEDLVDQLKSEIGPLQKRIKVLEDAISRHRVNQGRKVVWANDRALYSEIGMTYPARAIPSWQSFMTKAAAYRASLDGIEEGMEGVDFDPISAPPVAMPTHLPPALPGAADMSHLTPEQRSHMAAQAAAQVNVPDHVRAMLEGVETPTTPPLPSVAPPPADETREQFLERMRHQMAEKRKHTPCRECNHPDHTGRICSYTGPGFSGMCDCNDLQLGPTSLPGGTPFPGMR